MVEMNKWQAAANEVYPDELIAQCVRDDSHRGDTLALFLARELSEAESTEEALRMMYTAERELAAVIEALLVVEDDS